MGLRTDAGGRLVDDQGGRVYRIEGTARKVLIGQAAVSPVLMTLFAVYLFHSRGPSMLPALVAFALASLSSSALLLGMVFKVATVLYPDRIEQRGLFQTRAMAKPEIASFHRGKTSKGADFLLLTPRQSGQAPLQVPRFKDAEFELWFRGIPETSQTSALAL